MLAIAIDIFAASKILFISRLASKIAAEVLDSAERSFKLVFVCKKSLHRNFIGTYLPKNTRIVPT